MKLFYQCDVAESDTDSIWTGPVVYGSLGEAEFETMLVLQQDWGDSYMPEGFLNDFGRTEDQMESSNDPVYPGDSAWKSAGYWNELEVTTGMLILPPIEALAQLGKIRCDLPSDVIDAALAGQAQLHVVVSMEGGQPMKLFAVDLMVCATAYIVAKDSREACRLAQAHLVDAELELSRTHWSVDDHICIDGRPFEALADNDEPIALSPVMTVATRQFHDKRFEQAHDYSQLKGDSA